jgi:hypothetical protein
VTQTRFGGSLNILQFQIVILKAFCCPVRSRKIAAKFDAGWFADGSGFGGQVLATSPEAARFSRPWLRPPQTLRETSRGEYLTRMSSGQFDCRAPRRVA